MLYNWQQSDWRNFSYNLQEFEAQLLHFAEHIGKISGAMRALPEQSRLDISISSMVIEAVKTSEIEGEYVGRQDVVSSIRNNLGLDTELKNVRDKRASGVSELMLDVSNSFAEPLSIEKLFSWHRMLMKGNTVINAGVWRTHSEPMQVISGAMGREKVHFEAPPSNRVPEEMEMFVKWFNDTSPTGSSPIRHAPVRAAIAHLYFETIHPFEDGNGRIGRAIAEKVISQNAGTPIPLSLSGSIEANKKEYYQALESAQRSNTITDWIGYFLTMILDAQERAEQLIEFALKKAQFFDRFQNQMNQRQLKVVRRMLENGPEPFEGGMNARKYVGITGASKATATRDLQDLRDKQIFLTVGGGRSTRYQVNI